MSDERTSLARIGAGSFAEVFVLEGRSSVALKVVKDGSRFSELSREYNILEALLSIVPSQGNLFSFPAASAYFPSFSVFEATMALSPDMCLGMGDNAACLYVMERVWPVPRTLQIQIRTRYFPAEHKGCEKSFIARVYLGKVAQSQEARQAPPKRFFNPNNWPLDSAALEDLGLPVARIATDMGRLLAGMHHFAKCDARDVEFVMGGDPLDPFRKFKFYCIDFNQVRDLDNEDNDVFIDTVVESFFINDPYYPRSGMKYWEEFKAGYLSEALKAQDHGNNNAYELAEQILRRIVARAHK